MLKGAYNPSFVKLSPQLQKSRPSTRRQYGDVSQLIKPQKLIQNIDNQIQLSMEHIPSKKRVQLEAKKEKAYDRRHYSVERGRETEWSRRTHDSFCKANSSEAFKRCISSERQAELDNKKPNPKRDIQLQLSNITKERIFFDESKQPQSQINLNNPKSVVVRDLFNPITQQPKKFLLPVEKANQMDLSFSRISNTSRSGKKMVNNNNSLIINPISHKKYDRSGHKYTDQNDPNEANINVKIQNFDISIDKIGYNNKNNKAERRQKHGGQGQAGENKINNSLNIKKVLNSNSYLQIEKSRKILKTVNNKNASNFQIQ